MNNKLIKFNLSQRKDNNIPEIKAGDIVKVHRKIKEGNKERIQIFEGMIIAVNGKQSSSPTITVRKVSNGVGVELVLPIYSPNIDRIELIKRAKVRRSKLYYIRDKSAKSMRLKYQDMTDFAKAVEEKKEENVVEESVEKEEKSFDKKEEKNTKNIESKFEDKSEFENKKENEDNIKKEKKNKEKSATDEKK